MVRLYSTHCPKCRVIEQKLKAFNIECEIIDDKAAVINYGKEHSILSAPILEADGVAMDFAAANNWVNEHKQ